MSLPIHLSHLGFLGVSELQKHNSGKAKKYYAELDLSQSIQEVPCFVLVWELHALESFVLGGFERDEGGKEKKVLFGEYHSKGTAAQSWRTG